MSKAKVRVNSSRRNFLTGSASLAGLAATAAITPLTFASANHKDGSKGFQILLIGKIEMH